MLELQHLYRSFRTIPAIQDISFRMAPGEIVGFLGPNGAGKSTTVKIITGMLRPDEGRVLFEGNNIRDDMVAFRAAIGYVPEEAHLYSYLSGLEYLQLVGRLRGIGEFLLEAKATACSGSSTSNPGNTRPSPRTPKECVSVCSSPPPSCTIPSC